MLLSDSFQNMYIVHHFDMRYEINNSVSVTETWQLIKN